MGAPGLRRTTDRPAAPQESPMPPDDLSPPGARRRA